MHWYVCTPMHTYKQPNRETYLQRDIYMDTFMWIIALCYPVRLILTRESTKLWERTWCYLFPLRCSQFQANTQQQTVTENNKLWRNTIEMLDGTTTGRRTHWELNSRTLQWLYQWYGHDQVIVTFDVYISRLLIPFFRLVSNKTMIKVKVAGGVKNSNDLC